MQDTAHISVAFQSHEPKTCEGYLVQFYTSDHYLIKSLTEFIVLGVSRGEAILILATEAHADTLLRDLEISKLPLQRLISSKQLRFVDATKALNEILVENKPDVDKFTSLIRPYVQDAKHQFGKVKVYGELVNILCERGQYKDAIILEGYWNELLSADPAVSLMFGYSKNLLNSPAGEKHFLSICRSHSNIIGDETKLQLTHSHTSQLSQLGEVCVSVTQEINNPLAIIRLSIDQLSGTLERNQFDLTTAKLIQDRLKVIDAATVRIAKSIKSISQFAKTELAQAEEFKN